MQKTNQTDFRIEKVIKKKSDELYVKWKGYGNLFNSWIDKKLHIYMHTKNNLKVELNLSNYAAKSDLGKATGVDTAKFAEKADLASIK